MPLIEPHVREAGAGPGIVCTHSNASTSGQWRGLIDLLSPKYRVFAPDSYGAAVALIAALPRRKGSRGC